MTDIAARPAAPKRTVRELEDYRVEFERAPIWIGTVTDGNVRTEREDAIADIRAADVAHGWNLYAGKITNHSGPQISQPRGRVVQSFLDHPPEAAQWLLWLDSDMVPPFDIMPRLLAAATATKSKIIGALCVMVKDEGPTPTLYQHAPPGADGITIVQFDYEEDTITQVAATGGACVMVHREVYEALAAAMPGRRWPWYFEQEIAGHWISEDINFCLMAGELGYKTFVDCTTHVGHAKRGRVWMPSDIKNRIGFPPATRVVVIPVKNRLGLTRDLVNQLRQQGEATDIVICDNGSGRETKNWLSTQDDLTVLDMPEAGINEMWNAGCAWAVDRHGPRVEIVILNNDLRLGDGFVGELSRALASDPNLVAVSGNYDGRTGPGLVEETTDICAGRYDGTGGFAGFAFALKGAFFQNGYRFPDECRFWFGDNDLVQAIGWTPEGKAGIALRAHVEHIDGGSLTAGDPGWSKHREQIERDHAAFQKRWAHFAADHVRHRLAAGDMTPEQATELLTAMGFEPHDPDPDADIAVITVNFGDHDRPWPLPAQDIACDAILITDRPTPTPGWRNVVVAMSDDRTPRMAAKGPRCRPDRHTDAEIVVWFDAHLEVLSGSLVRELVEELGDGLIGAFRHGFHTSISQEAALASTLPKYAGYDLVGQAKHYLAEGHPDTWGMWTTGVMVRRPKDTIELGDAWAAEIDRWGPEDQISLPYVLRRCGITPVDLDFTGGWWNSGRFRLHPHNDGTM